MRPESRRPPCATTSRSDWCRFRSGWAVSAATKSQVLARLEVIGLCKAAGFTLEQIQVLFADDAPGRPASRALAEAKLAEIDARLESLARARAVIEWGMRCTCPSIDACTCGIHPPAGSLSESQSSYQSRHRRRLSKFQKR